jgi:3'-5' exonuclease
MNPEDILLLDIETVAQAPQFIQLDSCTQQLWTEKAARYPDLRDLSPEAAYDLRAAIWAEFGRIVCIVTGRFYFDKDRQLRLRLQTFCNHNEIQLLDDFLQHLSDFTHKKRNACLGGHNIKEFDIPYICRRLMAHRRALPKILYLHGQKPWENNHLDTLHWWRFGDYKHYISLKLLASVLNLGPAKQDMDGSQVGRVYYEENNLDAIAAYCADDVRLCARIVARYLQWSDVGEEIT